MDNLWDTVKSAIPTGLGFLANAIIPGTGGIAASLISGVLDCDETPQAIEAGLRSATPDQIARLKTEANRHKEKLIELAYKNEVIRLQDVQSARQRQIASEAATGKRDINLYVLSYVVVVGFFGLVGFLIFKKLPPANVGPVNQLFGAISAGFGMVLAYFFGSSKSSADKTALMGTAAKK